MITSSLSLLALRFFTQSIIFFFNYHKPISDSCLNTNRVGVVAYERLATESSDPLFQAWKSQSTLHFIPVSAPFNLASFLFFIDGYDQRWPMRVVFIPSSLSFGYKRCRENLLCCTLVLVLVELKMHNYKKSCHQHSVYNVWSRRDKKGSGLFEFKRCFSRIFV